MASNSFGTVFRFTTWGESHGEAIGCVIDGCPSRIPLSEADIQPFLDARKPGQNKFTTQRKEPDTVKILSGVYEGLTTGTPISLIIYNEDQRSKDYSEIANSFRPGHADYTYQVKYGHRDPRGGGRSSARETAMRVAAGAVARKVIASISNQDSGFRIQEEGSSPPSGGRLGGGGVEGFVSMQTPPPQPSPVKGEGVSLGSPRIIGYVVEMGGDGIDRAKFDADEISRNPFWCPDADAAARWAVMLDDARKSGSSLGAVIEVVAEGVPAGLGEPIYDKLDSDLARAMMSINAVKAVEIGDGFAAARLRGEENADRMRMQDSASGIQDSGKKLNAESRIPTPQFLSNHAGGILGGISSGQPIIVRFAVKPTSSILTPVETITATGENTEIITKGRHDPCVGIRAVPVGEAMMACVLADHLLRFRAYS